jgi:hypothetical protein
MELSSWPQAELEALAWVYIKHRRVHKAAALRQEIGNRLSQQAATTDNGLEQIFAQLDDSNVVTLGARVASLRTLFTKSLSA